ncbi:hypothetical protein [Amycolatopsis saalfeldensis]|uniref:Uncharacterized protein n=1 Tax=Amycolatopsis saalfeldensis TaxID=394193 RepID=A0A1H8XDE3_9PSEU|nr:hypothetical protein [Amycolatopsis saalfeldensis]SEP37896.1 hypothetical protein SAMN04489732_10782 [Amycolatopsis saalfeldensis]
MQAMSDVQRAALATAVEQLAWTAVREVLELEPGEGPRSDLPDADLRQMWLTALTSLLAIRDSAEQLAASTALSAAQRGADYPEIGHAAGMTRQGARRKWPGLAGLSDERRRKLTWWNQHGREFADSVRAVLADAGGQREPSRLTVLRERLDEIERASPAARIDACDMVLIDAHAIAMNTASGHAGGLLAALIADAYAATTSHSALVSHDSRTCAADDCPDEPIVEVWRANVDRQAVPVCRAHAIDALGQPATRIVAAYRPDVALIVFTEANGDA